MASSTASPNPGTGETYTAMAPRDGDNYDDSMQRLGKHCDYCRQNDFLPFTCNYCKGTFCLDHRSLTAHSCPKATSTPHIAGSTAPVADERTCAEPTCKSKISPTLTTGVQCTTCNRQYCLKHRMDYDHNCKNLVPLGARPAQNRRQGPSPLARLKAWAEEQRAMKEARNSHKKGILGFSVKKSSAAAQAFADLQALKKGAKGDEKVPMDKRVYLHVEASADTTKSKYPTGKFWYSKEWTVGRVLDMAAKSLQVQNVNNRGGGEEEKLRVFHVEGGRLLKFGEKIGEPCQSGNMIVLLRGVGSGEVDLIDL